LLKLWLARRTNGSRAPGIGSVVVSGTNRGQIGARVAIQNPRKSLTSDSTELKDPSLGAVAVGGDNESGISTNVSMWHEPQMRPSDDKDDS
jgi:hypothetical protein